MAAFAQHYERNIDNAEGIALLKAAQHKNIELLMRTKKDMDLLLGVYGSTIHEVGKKAKPTHKRART